MRKPRLLDLFAGAGGAAEGYHRAGFEVVGVDIDPQPNYPYEFHQADAVTFPYYGFDAVHASPPCQGYSTKTRDKSKHPLLISVMRERLRSVPFVIENVEGARSEMVEPIRLCGSSFGLDVRRHRLFESNWPLVAPPCNHRWQTPRFSVYDHKRHYLARTVPVFGEGGGKAREHWADAMGIDWMTDAEMAEAIPPAYTEWIGRQLHAYLRAKVSS